MELPVDLCLFEPQLTVCVRKASGERAPHLTSASEADPIVGISAIGLLDATDSMKYVLEQALQAAGKKRAVEREWGGSLARDYGPLDGSLHGTVLDEALLFAPVREEGAPRVEVKKEGAAEP